MQLSRVQPCACVCVEIRFHLGHAFVLALVLASPVKARLKQASKRRARKQASRQARKPPIKQGSKEAKAGRFVLM